MRKLVVANLKANQNMSHIGEYIVNLNMSLSEKHDIVICPSFVHIPFFTSEHFTVGAQNVSIYDNGSYTGEVTISQLKSSNVKYVIVGHSERRTLFQETDEIVNKKASQCLKENLIPILCIGDSKEDKIQGKTELVLRRSLMESLKNIPKDMMSKIVIAYEPIWAIGTGITPTPKEIEETVLYIKDIIKSAYKVDLRVLYGGSVSAENISKFGIIECVDGFLVGTACKDANEFNEVVSLLN